MTERYAAVTGMEAIAKLVDLAAKNQRVEVTRDLEGSSLYGDDAEWSIESTVYCDDPDDPYNPETFWTLSVGHDNSNPWMGASVSFRTKHIIRVAFINTRPDVVIR